VSGICSFQTVKLESVPTSVPNPIDSLSANNRQIFNALLDVILNYGHPETVRIYKIDESESNKGALKIMIMRQEGNGNEQTILLLFEGGSLVKESSITSYTIPWSYADIGAINKALIQHWKDLGITE